MRHSLMRDAMNPNRPKSRIAEQDFDPGTRSRVALKNRANVFANPVEHGKPFVTG